MALKRYSAEKGDCEVPQSLIYQGLKLGSWLHSQRQNRAKCKLSEDRIKRLGELGVAWDPRDERWEKNFEALKQYMAIHGDCFVPQSCIFQNRRLGTWVSKQRQDRARSRLSDEKIQRLVELGFDWDPTTTLFEKGFVALKQYKEQFGDCLVPDSYTINGVKLGMWVRTKRASAKQGKLSVNVVDRLNSIGFVWELTVSDWDQ